MKPYGVRVIENPDIADLAEMGAKSSVGHYPGRSGDYHSNSRSSASKAATRRFWARKARKAGKDACCEY